MQQKNNIWFSFFNRNGYYGTAPPFYSPQQKGFEWTKLLENNWQLINKELQQLIKTQHQMEAYFDADLVTTAQSWKTIALFWWGVSFKKNCQKCPATTRLLQQIPGMVSASFNLLKAGSTIKPHHGDTDAIVRTHLGLVIPGTLPHCGFLVAKKQHPWETGKTLLFCDAHKHTAWNHTTQDRYILLIDVILPQYLPQQKHICSTILASLFLQSLAQKLPFIANLPLWMQNGLHFWAKTMGKIAVPVWNYFN